MPLFDFRCKDCAKRFTMLVGVVSEKRAQVCPSCGSDRLTKLMSRVSVARSEDQMLDDLADIDKLGDIEDPKTLRKWVREMGKSMDEDMSDDLEEMFEEEAAKGDFPGESPIY